MDTGFLIIAWIVSGVIGLVLGAIVDKLGAGFFLGLLLGPIGWIIVFLLPRDTQTQVANAESTPASKPTSSRPERDLDSDAYKIWLGKQYNITKNDLFDKYECDEKLFATLDEALIYADQKEREIDAAENAQLQIEQIYKDLGGNDISTETGSVEDPKTEDNTEKVVLISIFVFIFLITFGILVS